MFITYKIINLITGEFYIGSHKTNNPNDKYMGSGIKIKESIKQYGIENHKKEIIEIFDNREDSLNLEHSLVKRAKEEFPDKVLNITNGGTSFDYLNEHYTFDRSAFGKMASEANREFWEKVKKENIERYNANPKFCKTCGKQIDYAHRVNDFCSSSCAAIFNNPKRRGTRTKIVICKRCGKEFEVAQSNKIRKFCCRECMAKYYSEHSEDYAIPRATETTLRIVRDLEIIRKRHETESYAQIAKDYGVSRNYIKDAVKGRVGKSLLKNDNSFFVSELSEYCDDQKSE